MERCLMFHHILPGARCQFRIRAVEIHPGQCHVELRLAFRVIARVEEALRFLFVGRLETRLFAGDFVFEVEHAPRAADQTEG